MTELKPGEGYWIYVVENFSQRTPFNLNITMVRELPDRIIIGDIVASPWFPQDREEIFVSNLILPDLNAYVRSLGYNVAFEFIILDAEDSSQRHLELIQEIHERGVDIIIGSIWMGG